ncbi:hypothetical protein [Streptomyces brevispora]|uniref:Uncharacterized protein n=1 Tax=Streptomyces brevispora TaxID=887462 RepID=A0A561UTW0_9ACTN|nr:hypothetical protein [Streptomyces brevispora]TWG02800.1 hypothetical protein FHX80_111211 [Streptomyces brevispora]WSC16088.1 hypothetical protein OIE64_26840 [Streptomyces brevispora]
MAADLVQDSWTRIDAWLREHAPRTFATLRPPAGDKEIAGSLSNPAIDSSWYAAQYTQDQD